jgi:hypothetical protein
MADAKAVAGDLGYLDGSEASTIGAERNLLKDMRIEQHKQEEAVAKKGETDDKAVALAQENVDKTKKAQADNPVHKMTDDPHFHPWEEKLPEVDPMRAFGSAASVFGVLAGALTRKGIASSLDASGAAMKALRANDLATYADAKQTWKDNIEWVKQKSEAELADYEHAMDVRKTDFAAGTALLQASAAKWDNQALLHSVKSGNDEHMVGQLDSLAKSKQQFETHAMTMQEKGLEIEDKLRTKAAITGEARKIDPNYDKLPPGSPARLAVEAKARDQMEIEKTRAMSVAKNAGKPGDVQLTREQIDALAKGLTKISDYGRTAAQRSAIMSQVTALYPEFDSSYYVRRDKALSEFSNPDSAISKNVTSINTSIEHMDTLKKLADAMHNGDTPAVNSIVNKVNQWTGHSDVTNAKLAILAVGEELAKSFRGTGSSALAEIAAWQDALNVTDFTKEQADGALRTAGGLLAGRANEVNETYKRTIDTDENLPRLLSPKAKEALQNLGLDPKDFGAGEKKISIGQPVSHDGKNYIVKTLKPDGTPDDVEEVK